jgi:RNA polymerase sigma factor (sigma-70 family)
MQIDSLGALLNLLGNDPEKAGAAYRGLHQRLIRFFRLHGRPDPEALADEVMNRLARIAASATPDIGSAEAFAVGIARNIVQEDIRRQIREEQTSYEWETSRRSSEPDEESALLALKACLSSFPTPKQQLLRSYYTWTGTQKILHHQHLASELGLTVNALRNRLMRAKKELETCVRQRLRDTLPPKHTHHRKEERNP